MGRVDEHQRTVTAYLREERWIPTWLSFVRIHARLWDELDAQMRKGHRLTMARYDVLAHLVNAGGRLGLSTVASSIMLSPSAPSKHLDRMEQSGLVRRDSDPDDARSTFATITRRVRSIIGQARDGRHHFPQ